MDTVDITLTLPEELVARARSAGLLTAERVAEWLAAELERRQRVDQLFADVQKLYVLEPPLTQEEIDAEIRAYREEKRRGDAGSL